jgi:hypothetical protein
LGRANLHPYRLKIKELRNLLQMAENSNQQEFVQRLGEVKDAIGEWHDWEQLGAIARTVLDHAAECHLLRELKRVADNKYRNALALSEDMRKKLLRITDHRHKHSARQPRSFARCPAQAPDGAAPSPLSFAKTESGQGFRLRWLAPTSSARKAGEECHLRQ